MMKSSLCSVFRCPFWPTFLSSPLGHKKKEKQENASPNEKNGKEKEKNKEKHRTNSSQTQRASSTLLNPLSH